MPELSGIEAFGLGIGVHWSRGAIAHFTPLNPTFNHLRRNRSIKIFIDLSVKLRQFGQRRIASFPQWKKGKTLAWVFHRNDVGERCVAPLHRNS
jgi:hypothetical protein